MKELELFIPIAPVAASRPRVTRWATFYSKKYTAYRNVMEEHLSKRKDLILFEKSVAIDKVIFYMKIPKLSKKKMADLVYKPHVKKPDIDNLLKALFDSLNGHVFRDDSIIWKIENIQKIYSDVVGVGVHLKGA